MLTVVIVDDEPINRVVLRAMLEAVDARVLEASNGADGLEILGSTACDVLLTDVHMPNMSGLEMVRRLRISTGPNQDIVSVAVTADTTLTHEAAGAFGLDGLIHKPVTIANVLGALKTERRATASVSAAYISA